MQFEVNDMTDLMKGFLDVDHEFCSLPLEGMKVHTGSCSYDLIWLDLILDPCHFKLVFISMMYYEQTDSPLQAIKTFTVSLKW